MLEGPREFKIELPVYEEKYGQANKDQVGDAVLVDHALNPSAHKPEALES